MTGMKDGNNINLEKMSTANGNTLRMHGSSCDNDVSNSIAHKSLDSSIESSASTSGSQDQALNSYGRSTMAYNQIVEKLVYLVSVLTVIVLAYGVLAAQWMIPYYYTITTPVLIGIRAFMYVKWKWQFFLLDFCYFCNTFLLIYIWACPVNPIVFSVVFGMANGPLISAIVIFRNSLVFHDIDKLISTYIHILPPLLTFCIRWYPDKISTYWYTSFVTEFSEPSFIWLVAVPLGCFVSHGIVYFILVRVIIRPKEEYLDSFRLLGGKENTWTARMINCAGPKGRIWLFMLYNWLMGLASTLLARLWYEFYIAHCILLCIGIVVVTWNGGTFYLDVFSRKDNQNNKKVKPANI